MVNMVQDDYPLVVGVVEDHARHNAYRVHLEDVVPCNVTVVVGHIVGDMDTVGIDHMVVVDDPDIAVDNMLILVVQLVGIHHMVILDE